MNSFKLKSSTIFEKSYKILTRKSKSHRKRVEKTLNLLGTDPYHIGLNTHKVLTKKFGTAYSSRVTGDIRIIWKFSDKKLIILLLTIQGHEVYK